MPKLILAGSALALGEVLQDARVEFSIEIGNAGTAPLRITGMEGPAIVTMTTSAPATVQPAAKQALHFVIDTDTPGDVAGQVRLIHQRPRGASSDRYFSDDCAC